MHAPMHSSSPKHTASTDWLLTDGAAMGAAIRAFDWSATSIGAADSWPANLRTLLNVMLGAHQPMFLTWGPERLMLYNDAYGPLLGQRHPDALGQSFDRVWHDILADIRPILDRAYAGQGTRMDDIRLVMHRNGYPEETHFAFSYTPVPADDGSIAGMFCACEETTKAVLAARQRSSEIDRLRELFDRSPAFTAVLSGPEHRVELTNNRYLTFTGGRDIVGKTTAEAIPEAVDQGFIALLDEVYRSGEAFSAQSMPYTIHLPDGRVSNRMVDFVYQPISDDTGQTTGIFVTGYDVTDRHRAERELRESEERFRRIADSAPVPIWVSDADRTREFVNQAYVDFVGLPHEEAARLDWRTILHEDDQDRIVAASIAGEASLEPFTLEARYRRGDGAWRWIRSISQPRLSLSGTIRGFIGVAHDVTEAKEAEIALRDLNETLEGRVAERTADLSAALARLQEEVEERERAQEALRQSQKMEAVGQLTGGIAHDFNNLLTPILGGLELIAARVDDPRLKRLADAALESGRRGAKLATQLLAFSRLQRISMAPVAVDAVIEGMERILRASIDAVVAVETKLNAGPGGALCDANQLENAVLNLALNARDSMPDGGRLTICTQRRQEPDGPGLAAGDYVVISVSDTGTGMTPEVLARATEPFFSTKPVGKGTGLGLAQVYGIAHQSGGTVRIDSTLNVGTEVRIYLPHVANERSKEVAVAAPGHIAQQPPARIMVVDDDPEVRAFLLDALDALGHAAEGYADGAKALERLDEADPDLLLVDFAMPGMNGAELANAVRARRPRQSIAFVTGFADSDQIDAIGAPALRKPFGIDALAAFLSEQLVRP